MRQKQGVFSLFLLSLSSRRAWIEIRRNDNTELEDEVALLAEGVDRNILGGVWVVGDRPQVALLAEGVDRNNPWQS